MLASGAAHSITTSRLFHSDRYRLSQVQCQSPTENLVRRGAEGRFEFAAPLRPAPPPAASIVVDAAVPGTMGGTQGNIGRAGLLAEVLRFRRLNA